MSDTNGETKFEQWALVEIMGRQRIVGKVTEAVIAGAGMLRVDVPDGKGGVKMTRFYSPASVYCISPVTQEIAVQMAARIDAAPVQRYELPQLQEASKSEDDDNEQF